MTTANAPRAVLALAIGLAGCTGTQSPDRAGVEYRGSAPATVRGTAPAPAIPAPETVPDPGPAMIRSYDGYAAAAAQRGDTVASLAARVGLPALDLAAYNGLSPDQALREGDELVLPPRAGGYGAPAPAPVEPSPIESAALDTGEGETAPGTAEPDPDTGWSPEIAAAAIARASGESATDPASAPIETGLDAEGRLAAPPSATEPLPPDPGPAPELVPPGLDQYQSPASEADAQDDAAAPPRRPPDTAADPDATNAGPADGTPVARALDRSEPEPRPDGWRRLGGLIRPVEAPIALGYGPGPNGTRNEGVDFAAPAGTPVVAAADGEVALVSKALGGIGTIVLLRHPDELLTVYGRLDGVTVAKGDIVSRGQRIGSVARPEPPAEARMHFEVREGARAVDPMSYLDG